MKVEGFFSGLKNANEAVKKLKSEGFDKAVTDINEHYVGNSDESPNIPGTETAPNQSSLTFNSGNFLSGSDESSSPLLAASPMASGMGGFEEIADVNYKVTVDVAEKDKERAKQVIKDMGGDLESYNPDLPKRINNMNI